MIADATAKPTPVWKVCKFCGREIEIETIAPGAFRAASKHNWYGPILPSVAEVEKWLKKIHLMRNSDKPEVVKVGDDHFMVVSKLGWFSATFDLEVKAREWLNWSNGENLNKRVTVVHPKHPVDLGPVTEKIESQPPPSGMNLPPELEDAMKRNGAPGWNDVETD